MSDDKTTTPPMTSETPDLGAQLRAMTPGPVRNKIVSTWALHWLDEHGPDGLPEGGEGDRLHDQLVDALDAATGGLPTDEEQFDHWPQLLLMCVVIMYGLPDDRMMSRKVGLARATAYMESFYAKAAHEEREAVGRIAFEMVTKYGEIIRSLLRLEEIQERERPASPKHRGVLAIACEGGELWPRLLAMGAKTVPDQVSAAVMIPRSVLIDILTPKAPLIAGEIKKDAPTGTRWVVVDFPSIALAIPARPSDYGA